MAKITVELVKYDTEKTRKRKRADMIVDARTEAAVISKLERIHKGDKVKEIFEIVWAEAEAVVEEREGALYTGVVKFFDEEKGFGFISADEEMEDLFFHVTALGSTIVEDHSSVEFQVSDGPKGPIAIKIKLIENEI